MPSSKYFLALVYEVNRHIPHEFNRAKRAKTSRRAKTSSDPLELLLRERDYTDRGARIWGFLSTNLYHSSNLLAIL